MVKKPRILPGPGILSLLCLLVQLLAKPLSADDFKIMKISPEGGFCYDAITSICEDRFGYIWFGSNSGVYRYNTIRTVKYINNPEDKFSLPGNTIRALYRDLNHVLWFATTSGLASFDDGKDQFIRYRFHDQAGNPRGNYVNTIFQTPDSSYWMVDNTGIARISFEQNQLTYLSVPETGPNKDQIRYAMIAPKGERIWLGGVFGGVYFVDPPYERMKLFSKERAENVNAIFPDKDETWVGYEWGGLDIFSSTGKLINHCSDAGPGKYRLPSPRVRNIARYRNDIWIGTFKGLVRVRPDGFEWIEKEKFTGLQSNSIYDLYPDSKSGLWIGTWSGGLSYINEWSNNFEHYKREAYVNSLSDNVVSDFVETADGKIIIATEEGYLNTLDPQTKNVTNYQISGPNGTVVNHIKSLHIDSRGTLWIGTYGFGIYYRTAGTSVFRHLDQVNDTKEQFFDITSDANGVWFGSNLRGLFYYSYATNSISQFGPKSSNPESISSSSIRALLLDSHGVLWVGTGNGLNQKAPGSDKFNRHFYNQDRKNRISSNLIYTLTEDSRGKIWIGTGGGGVSIYDPEARTFSQLSRKDGLSGNDVYGIIEDRSGSGLIWMSTENGLSAYNPVSGTFRNYEYTDGLPGNQFNPGSAYRARSGEIYFGGSNGFTRFDPKQMKENPVVPETFITGLEINNQAVSNHSDPDLIPQSLLTLGELVLKHDQNSLKLEFAANNFLLPEKNRFRYRLLGYSPDWIEIQKQNEAIFTKIPPGDYIFEVKASNNDGKWNETPARMKITILRPFWKSIYAILLYVVMIVVLVYLLQKELRLRAKLRDSILQERLQRENEEKLHQLKLQFFTNISHEFRTPLSLILSPLAMLKRKTAGQDEHTEHITLIENNARRLLRLVNQILDIRKIELGKIDFNPQSFDLVALSQEVFQCFSLQENDRMIKFVFESDFSSLFVTMEPDKIDKVIYNLLSNAIKYTSQGGTIRLSVKNSEWNPGEMPEPYHHSVGSALTGNCVTVVVKNEGAGIAAEDVPHIFERFFQAHGQLSGTGIGLHLCSEYIRMHNGQIEVYTGENMGATFLIRLPVSEQEIEKGVQEAIFHTVISREPSLHSSGHSASSGKPASEVKILVVEDNREMQRYLYTVLSENFHVITADNGTEGLKLVREHGPDLVLTDIMMPGMDGNELCHLIKTDLNTSHIPVIILTALSSVESQLEGLETGADEYIVKPFDDRLLLVRIRKILDSRAVLREKFTRAPVEWQEEMQNFRPDRELLDAAAGIIENHLVDLNFSVDILASELNLSRSSLHRKLRALTNQSATEFIKFVRINKSIKIIESGETNIDEICFKVGFNSHSYFSMCFKKQLGLTPSEYISKMKRESRKESPRLDRNES